jgi:hypothetical protein
MVVDDLLATFSSSGKSERGAGAYRRKSGHFSADCVGVTHVLMPYIVNLAGGLPLPPLSLYADSPSCLCLVLAQKMMKKM